MALLQTLLITVVTLGILVTVHEYGHFWVARRCGVKVLRFSIGFGKPLLKWYDRQGTEFAVAAIPLGGYVKMLDEREGEVAPEDRHLSFNAKPVSRRLAIVAAGPIANFLLAIVTYWVLFLSGESGVAPIIDRVMPDSIAARAGLEAGQEIVSVDGEATPTWQALNLRLLHRIGESGPLTFEVRYPDSSLTYESSAELHDWLAGEEAPNLVSALGIELYQPEVEAAIAEVLADSPAERAGLKAGDRIVSADGQAMANWSEWVDYVRARPEQSIQLEVLRDGSTLFLPLTPEKIVDDSGESYGRVGVAPQIPEWPEEMRRQFSYGPWSALTAAMGRTAEMSLFTLESIKKMLVGLISPKNLSGPITIAKVAAASAQSGLESYLSFLALLSISLGVLNLLPIPVLDGGHLLFGVVEWIRGRPLPERIQMLGYQLGLIIIVGIMMLALYNDLARL